MHVFIDFWKLETENSLLHVFSFLHKLNFENNVFSFLHKLNFENSFCFLPILSCQTSFSVLKIENWIWKQEIRGKNSYQTYPNFYFLSPSFFQPILAWNHAIMVFFNFLNFFAFFWNFLFRIGLVRNGTIIFIFSLSRSFPSNFGLK